MSKAIKTKSFNFSESSTSVKIGIMQPLTVSTNQSTSTIGCRTAVEPEDNAKKQQEARKEYWPFLEPL